MDSMDDVYEHCSVGFLSAGYMRQIIDSRIAMNSAEKGILHPYFMPIGVYVSY
jgi:hypothetical protein